MNNKNLKSLIDGYDNENNYYHINEKGVLFLNLRKDKDVSRRDREIGKIFLKDGLVIYYKKEKESQRFRKLDAWSLPAYIFSKVDIIYFKTEEEVYRLKVKDVIHKDFRHYKVNTELKVYIPVSLWAKKSEQEETNNT